MIDLEAIEIPYTGGRYYTFIERDVFEHYFDKLHDERISDLTPGEVYTFFRVAKDMNTDEVVFLKITGLLIAIDSDNMIFVHDGSKGKRMSLDNFSENWFFVHGKV